MRRHLLEKVPISDLCDALGIQPTQYYQWQKQFFENGAGAFERRPNRANLRRQDDAKDRTIAQLEAKLAKKNEVISELMEENIQSKKATGEP